MNVARMGMRVRLTTAMYTGVSIPVGTRGLVVGIVHRSVDLIVLFDPVRGCPQPFETRVHQAYLSPLAPLECLAEQAS